MKKDTKIVRAGRSAKWTNGVVNPPVVRASTVLFDSVSEMQHAAANRANQVPFYGRRGTPTTFAFADAMSELEGAKGCYVYPCGTAAITSAMLSFVKAGDHVLVVDTVYEPTRDFCDKTLSRMGVSVTYYDPMIGSGIEALMRDNTSVIFLESPGSLTMEVQDVPGICHSARQKNSDVVIVLDNTWASPIHFQPFTYGVDVSVQAATKYVAGHSDCMLGTATANARCWPTLRENSYLLGQCASPDDSYLALRGLRTIGVRLKQHQRSSLTVARWLAERPEVEAVLHPALESCPGHEFFKRDFLGGNGLFSFILKPSSPRALTAMLDSMVHFKMGFSWGGFESLILANRNVASQRTVTHWPYQGPLVRLHIGLEDVDDLIADLQAGLARYNEQQ
ncbi:cystathionine beta-lyase [Thalassotalea ponticola]|uniref:cystathionine beta-lyase n=1 Tax=Thalassotalea ponticola TaxID=1523392 RepID=UPI0025B28C6F|nr:cystathionine beta-lyase [Thalassotalea ponticola]MDN3651197.1 cystathionine beta-lyase [Thalassotalea ponticola]